MGDYAKTAPVETFTATPFTGIPTDLAMLAGARLVTANETEENRRWAEARIKSLTGGDTITARFMRQDFFEFKPQFKILISGNHKPGLRTVDEAIRRRFNLVPFSVTIAPEKRDHKLKEKLRAEWPGILAWAIDGCQRWQHMRLAAPEAVTNATDEYLQAEDSIAAWLEACCTPAPDAWESRGALYASWKSWADQNGEFAGTNKAFIAKLDTRGLRPARTRNGRGFYGYKISHVFNDGRVR